MVDIPLNGIEIHEDGRRCAVRIHLVIDGVNPRHKAARAVTAVVVALKAVDAVDERARLLLSVGILLDACELGLDGVGWLCRKHCAEGCERKHEGQHECADFLLHEGFSSTSFAVKALR